MSWPTDICKCGHKRSEHLEPGCYCPEKGFTYLLKWSKFDLNPDATAHGWNHDQLTQAQVGTAEGWRLLDEDETGDDPIKNTQWWKGERYGWTYTGGWFGGVCCNLRTRLTRAALRAARGLEPEVVAHVSRKPDLVCALCGGTKGQCIERRCWGVYNENMVLPPNTLTGGAEGSTQSLAASAVVAQADRTDDPSVKHKVPAPPVNLSELRIRVAELCGWHPTPEGYWTTNPAGQWAIELPDYPCDLNACHEFEEAISAHFLLFESHLKEICLRDWRGTGGDQPYCNSFPIHATAEQRCRAFVAVKGGK